MGRTPVRIIVLALALGVVGVRDTHQQTARLAYWPVRMHARFDEHGGVVWKALANTTPSRAMRSMCGARR